MAGEGVAEGPAWVIRGGMITADQLQEGARLIRGRPGLCEVSVGFRPGLSVQELAEMAHYPHARIGFADRAALLSVGVLAVVETPSRSNPVHADLILPCSAVGVIDRDLLHAVAARFRPMTNPFRS